MIFLSSSAQYYLQTGQRILFGVSMLFSLVSLYCLVKETPPHQAKIRNYLLITQVAVIFNSIYMDILFEPIPLFPALAGICTGVLCKVGVTPHTVFGGLIFTYIYLGASTFFCCYFRYQTLLPENVRLGKVFDAWKSRALIIFCLLACAVPCTAYAAYPFDTTRYEMMMITSPYNIDWATRRGPYFIHEASPLIFFFIAVTLLLVFASVVAFLGIFFRMFYVLNKNKTTSPSTLIKIRKSLTVLFIQLCTPFFMLEAPVIGMFFALLVMRDIIPFEMYLFGFSIMYFHPLCHNLILLGITPTYRNIIKSFLCNSKRVFDEEHRTAASVARVEGKRRGPSLAWATPASLE